MKTKLIDQCKGSCLSGVLTSINEYINAKLPAMSTASNGLKSTMKCDRLVISYGA